MTYIYEHVKVKTILDWLTHLIHDITCLLGLLILF
jgi:hypothetical protein